MHRTRVHRTNVCQGLEGCCYCCSSVIQSCLTLQHHSPPGSSILYYLAEFAQIHVHWLSDASRDLEKKSSTLQKVTQSSWKIWRNLLLRDTEESVLGTWILKSGQRLALLLVKIWTKAGSDWWISKQPKILLFLFKLRLCSFSSQEVRVYFFTPCIWLCHVNCFVIQAEAWALGLSCLWIPETTMCMAQ